MVFERGVPIILRIDEATWSFLKAVGILEEPNYQGYVRGLINRISEAESGGFDQVTVVEYDLYSYLAFLRANCLHADKSSHFQFTLALLQKASRGKDLSPADFMGGNMWFSRRPDGSMLSDSGRRSLSDIDVIEFGKKAAKLLGPHSPKFGS